MTSDPFAELAGLEGVDEAAQRAAAAVDEVLWDRRARRLGSALGAESTVVGAWCDAAFDGAEVGLDALRAGVAEDSAMGRIAARTLAMYARIPRAAVLWERAPTQALAHLHTVLAAGLVAEEAVGRPRCGDDADDPLRLGPLEPGSIVAARLSALSRGLVAPSAAPAVVIAGVVHGELASLRPFAWGSGLLARALTRVVLRVKGLDPDGWTIPEAGMRIIGRPKYVAALRGYSSGSSAGVAEWLVLHAEAIRIGAVEAGARISALQGT